MTTRVSDVMTKNLVLLEESESARAAAEKMRDSGIGDVLVVRGQKQLAGILTDRDIVVRCIAEGKDPASTPVSSLCSSSLTTLSPDAEIDEAVRVMRDRAVRRLPVVENGQAVGIVSIGDLAQERDRRSVLGEISAAPPNN